MKKQRFKFGDKIHYKAQNGKITNAIYVREGKVVIKSNSYGDNIFIPRVHYGKKVEIKKGWKS